MRAAALLAFAFLAASGCLQGVAGPGASTPTPSTSTSTSGAPPGTTAPPTTGDATASDGTATATASPPPPAWVPGNWTDDPCPAFPSAAAAMPDLATYDGSQLTVLSWNGTHYSERAHRPAAAGGKAAMVLDGDGSPRLYAGNALGLEEFDRDLQPLASLVTEGSRPLSLLTGQDGHLWLARGAVWNLTVYAPGLHVVANVSVGVPQSPGMAYKGLDSLVLAGGVAYVVDDLFAPFYVFRLDVRDLAAPAPIDHRVLAGNVGPRWQWLDAAGGTWYVEQATVTGGSEPQADDRVLAIATATGAATPGPQLAVTHNADSPFPDGAPLGRPSDLGNAILATQPRLPAWTVARGNGTLWLGRVDFAGPDIHVACRQTLPDAAQGVLAADAAHVATVTSGRLQVRALQPGFPLVADQALPAPVQALFILPPA